MGSFTRGDIVLFPFPYTDLTNRKLRPCLALSNEFGDDILLCQITSKRIQKDEHTIDLPQNKTNKGSLMLDSYIRANMLFTGDKHQIHKKVCEITPEKYQEVVDTIKRLISQ